MRKNVWRTVLIVLLCFALGAVSAYGWFERMYVARANGITVEIADPEQGDLWIAATQDGSFSTACSKGVSQTLIPATTDDGKGFYNQAAKIDTKGTSYLSTDYWLKSDEDLTSVSVSDIIVTGAVDDEYAKALRVSVTYGKETMIFAPVEGADETIDFFGTLVSTDEIGDAFSTGIGTTPMQAIVNVWFEGGDSHCTASNAEKATGGLNITLRFAAR